MINVSNRQALLLADSVFNRQGTVPGILGAILVSEDNANKAATIGFNGLKESLTKANPRSPPFGDVTEELVIEQERQMILNGGSFNLFTPQFMAKKGNKVTLEDMGMKSKVPSSGTIVMLVRFVRGGDGERCMQKIKFDSSGALQWEADEKSTANEAQVLKLDADPCALWATKVTKEEFINCFLNSALLGEALRRMGSSDHQFHRKMPIALEVTITDPHGEEEAKEVAAAMQIHQSLLIEVMDDDTFKKDMLGEAWLPPLGEVGPHARDFVLPLSMPDFSPDAENGPSRHAMWKEKFDIHNPKDPKIVATGEVYVKIKWEFPLYQMTPDGKCVPRIQAEFMKPPKYPKEITDPAKMAEMVNTGMLTLTIDHARNLRRSDASKGRDCDPQAQVWLRNDILERWRKKPLIRTKTVRNNRNPEWKHSEVQIELMQGDYEARFPPKDHTMFEDMKQHMKTKRQKRYEEEERNLAAVKRYGDGLKIRFGENLGRGEGESHGMEVFLGDSIREFKAKLTEACARESRKWMQTAGAASPEAKKYEGTQIGPGHLVMVFVPPPKLMRLVETGNSDRSEYKHAHTLAIQDPSNWEPLDPTRTFDQYNPRHSFGKPSPAPPQQLMVVEATEKYKTTNLRYKEFDRERNKKLVVDMNEEERCFGWAKYKHEADFSFEWRPALISKIKPSASTATKKAADGSATASSPAPAAAQEPGKEMYSISWLVKPKLTDTKKPAVSSDDKGDCQLDRSSILMAPRMPKLDHYVHPKHMEVLKQAKSLRQLGKSDYEIEAMLNKILDEQNKPGTGVDKEKMASTKPPRITVDIIKKYMAHSENAVAL